MHTSSPKLLCDISHDMICKIFRNDLILETQIIFGRHWWQDRQVVFHFVAVWNFEKIRIWIQDKSIFVGILIIAFHQHIHVLWFVLMFRFQNPFHFLLLWFKKCYCCDWCSIYFYSLLVIKASSLKDYSHIVIMFTKGTIMAILNHAMICAEFL